MLISSEKLSSQTTNSVIITVGNSPITSLDLTKEIKIITLLTNIKIQESNKNEIKNLAIQSLVKRAIKKSEIKRLKITQYNTGDLERQMFTIAKGLGLDKENLKLYLKKNNIKYEDIEKNFEIDLKWNTAIFKLYKNKVSLNTVEIEEKIKSELERSKLKKFLLLSEIQVNLLDSGLEETEKKVLIKIREAGFENAAKEISISSTGKNGGSIGWIEETKLSKTVYNNVKNLKKGQISSAIKVEDTLVFIKKIDERSEDIDLEVIKKNIITQEKMKKLDMFSNSHYSDLEKRIKVKFL